MSSEKSDYPSSYSPPPAYPEGDTAPTAPPTYSTGVPAPDYTDTTGNSAGAYQPTAAPTTPYTNQYGEYFNQQYGQQTNVQVVQTEPGVMVIQRNAAAGQAYTGLFIGSILSLLCCWPLAIFAIVRASQAKTAAEMGRSAEAEERAGSAKMLIIASVVCGLIIIAINVVRIVAIQ